MIEVLEKALELTKSWSAERQTEAAELLLALDELGPEPHELDDDELSAIVEALAQVQSGGMANPTEVEALFARFRK